MSSLPQALPLGGGFAGGSPGREAFSRELRDRPPRAGRSDAAQELQDAKPRHLVARVLGPAQDCQHVLDVRGLEELQAAVLDERNVAPGELDLERVAVVRRPHQNRLVAQQEPFLASLEDHLGDHLGLARLVLDGDQKRPRPLAARRHERLAEASLALVDHRVGGVEDGLGRAVVAIERNHFGAAGESVGEAGDVADLGGAKTVDRLGVVAHHGETGAVGPQRQEDLGLERVGVLVLVDQDVIEALAHRPRQIRLAHQERPVEQQVVVVQHLLALLRHHVGLEETAQLHLPVRAPGEILASTSSSAAPLLTLRE